MHGQRNIKTATMVAKMRIHVAFYVHCRSCHPPPCCLCTPPIPSPPCVSPVPSLSLPSPSHSCPSPAAAVWLLHFATAPRPNSGLKRSWSPQHPMCFPPEDVINQKETDKEGTLLSAGRLYNPSDEARGLQDQRRDRPNVERNWYTLTKDNWWGETAERTLTRV